VVDLRVRPMRGGPSSKTIWYKCDIVMPCQPTNKMPILDLHDEVDRNWSMCVYQAASSRKQLSLHKNQLEIMDTRVKVLHTIDPDGMQRTIDCDGHQVSLIFSGGTDDPAIELQMKIGEAPKNLMIQNNKPFPPHAIIVLKYPALPAE
jgi:hypothetical protein